LLAGGRVGGFWFAVVAAGAVFIGLVLYLVGAYNALVQVRANVEKAWSNIDVLLKQRHDELPNLVETCKGYVKHEAAVLETISRLRGDYEKAGGIDEKARIENDLDRQMRAFNLTVEGYPDLKSSQNFLKIQERISALESSIADRREFFNDSVSIYNIRMQRIPEVFLAGPLGFRKLEFLDVPAKEKENVRVGFPPA
jgi:LemA protein